MAGWMQVGFGCSCMHPDGGEHMPAGRDMR